jgi:hypothetical protein
MQMQNVTLVGLERIGSLRGKQESMYPAAPSSRAAMHDHKGEDMLEGGGPFGDKDNPAILQIFDLPSRQEILKIWRLLTLPGQASGRSLLLPHGGNVLLSRSISHVQLLGPKFEGNVTVCRMTDIDAMLRSCPLYLGKLGLKFRRLSFLQRTTL